MFCRESYQNDICSFVAVNVAFTLSLYRATICVSADFAVARCPSVRLVIHTAEDIVKLLCRSGSTVILVFLTPNAYTQFQEEPLSGVQNTRSWGKFSIFDWNRRLSRKRYKIGPWLLWNVNRKSYALYRMVTFERPWRTPPGLQGRDIFEVEYLKMVSHRDKVTIKH